MQTALAASAAWFLATVLLSIQQPFYAPIAAVVSLGITVGERTSRAIQLVFGVAVGLTIADLLVLVIGTGTLQIAVVVALAMAAAVFLVGKPLLVTQAAISAMLVVTLQPPDAGFSLDRFFEALIGSGVALAVHVLLPIDPERRVKKAIRLVINESIGVLEETAAALADGDRMRADRALLRAREIDETVRDFRETLNAGHETARIAPSRRRALEHLELYAGAANQIDLTVRNVRVLARAAVSLLREDNTASGLLSGAVLDLARAVRFLDAYLEGSGKPLDTRRFALNAARNATVLLEEHTDLATSVLVGQIRATAVDLLRASGMNLTESLQALEETVTRPYER